jgi:nicotinamidase/pyrazinamidase
MKTAFLDVDSQLDFVNPSGALYVPGAERVVPAIARLNAYAAAKRIPLISTVDAHAENDVEFAAWPPHCIAGTLGQHKAAATLVGQTIAEKQTVDVFQSAHVREAIERAGAEHFVVYGVVTEICVLFAVRGLLRLGKRVTVVTDAIAELRRADAEKALEEARAGGARLASTEEVQAGYQPAAG